MSVPSSPEERRAEFFAGDMLGERVPVLVVNVPCPICGDVLTLDGYWTCDGCSTNWEPDGTNPDLDWDGVMSDPNHPLWWEPVVDVDTGGKT